ncbi:MAG: potassium channel protein [Desulfobacterales bacterium]|jgi:voltage-gated potassium channel|nr:potassium channel protein [Desulfobacterales bacterium]
MDYSKLRVSLALFFLIISCGTIGYSFLEDMSVFDAFYMTLITVSTVGFSEIKPLSEAGRLLTIIVIITGISVGTYTLGQLVQMLIEGELGIILGRHKLKKNIAGLKNHWIICGFGRIGRIISSELSEDNIAFVIVEQNPEKNVDLEALGYLYFNMDATSEEALIKAGINSARGIVTAVHSDANNVYITLTAKGLRPDIFILARASDEKNETKLLRAGASRVVCPYMIGGKRMAEVLKRPTVVDFLDTALMNSKLGLVMEEAVIGTGSPIAGKTLVDSNIRRNFGVIIVAIKKPDNRMVFNPAPTEILEANDVIVAIGKKEDLHQMQHIVIT